MVRVLEDFRLTILLVAVLLVLVWFQGPSVLPSNPIEVGAERPTANLTSPLNITSGLNSNSADQTTGELAADRSINPKTPLVSQQSPTQSSQSTPLSPQPAVETEPNSPLNSVLEPLLKPLTSIL